MQPQQAQFVRLFKEEAAEHLQQLQHGLLALQHDPQDKTALGESTQSADTLMGSALTLGFEEMSQQARGMRNRLAAARDGLSPLDTVALEQLLQSLDAICAVVDAVATGEPEDTGMGVPHTAALAVRTDLDQLHHELLRFERHPHDADLATHVRSMAHRLKERAEIGGLGAVAQVAQRTEDLLRTVEAGAFAMTAESLGLVLQGVGFIELLLDDSMGDDDEIKVDELCAMLDELLATVASDGVDRAPAVSDEGSLAAEEDQPQETPAMRRAGRQDDVIRESVRVLIASKSTLFSRPLADVIGREHHEVIMTHDAKDVVSHLQKKDVDLCFVRDSLPNGLDICEQVARDPAGNHAIPIIVYSPLSRVKHRALERGAAGFLKVPCLPQDVLALVDHWGRLSKRHSSDQ